MGRRTDWFAPKGMKWNYRLKELANPFNWYREFKWDHQRMSRGWSDRDTWNGGDFLLETTAGVLRELGDEKSHIDWKYWFELNINDTRGYKNLKEVAADIENYLAFQEKNWIDDLGFEIKHDREETSDGDIELVRRNTPNEERLIHKAIRESHEEEERLYRKARNAMIFVAINYRSLWD